MEIKCYNKKLEKTLSDNRTIKKVYGRLASRIMDVLDELTVAKTLDHIPTAPPDRRHKMTNIPFTWSIDLSANWRMWIKSDGLDDPKLVTTITIMCILDDH